MIEMTPELDFVHPQAQLGKMGAWKRLLSSIHTVLESFAFQRK